MFVNLVFYKFVIVSNFHIGSRTLLVFDGLGPGNYLLVSDARKAIVLSSTSATLLSINRALGGTGISCSEASQGYIAFERNR